MSAPKRNKYAQRGEAKSSSLLTLRCMRREKAGWVKAAQRAGVGLSDWVRDTLNRKANNKDEERP